MAGKLRGKVRTSGVWSWNNALGPLTSPQTIWVTGGSGGLGKEIAKAVAAQGTFQPTAHSLRVIR